MRAISMNRYAAWLCLAVSIVFSWREMYAQSSPCGNAGGNICSKQCGGSFTGFQFNNQGPDYGVTAFVGCGQCGLQQANIYNSPDCNVNGLSRRAIHGILASADGEPVLMPACSSGFRTLVEAPAELAQNDWAIPKAIPILR